MRKFWNVLSSRNVAITLLLIVTGILLVSEFLPNPNYMQDADVVKLRDESPVMYFLASKFNTQKVAGGYIFGALSIFLIISTTACSIDRIFEKRSMRKIPLNEIPVSEYDVSLRADDGKGVLQRLRTSLKLRRWNLREMKDVRTTMILAEKGTLGFIGSVFFHAILITVLFGGVYYYFTGFRGTLLFTEGQSILLSEEGLEGVSKRPLFGLRLPGLRISLEHFYALYWKDKHPVDYTAKFTVEDIEKGNAWEQTIKVNEPFRYGGLDFLITRYGFSPNFVIHKGDTKVLDSYVALDITEEREDSFRLEGEDLTVKCIFFPDLTEGPEGYFSESPQLENPVFFLKVARQGRYIYEGFLPLGREIRAEEYSIKFHDIRYWVGVSLVKETGIGFLFWSAMLGLGGLLLRFIDPDRRIYIKLEGDNLSVVSYSKHFEGILKEQTNDLINTVVSKREEI